MIILIQILFWLWVASIGIQYALEPLEYKQKRLYENSFVEILLFQEVQRCNYSCGIDYSTPAGWANPLLHIHILFWELSVEFDWR